MESEQQLFTYSWHQAHDEATVLLLVPYETVLEDVQFSLEGNYLVAGVRGHPPIIKGRLYGNVDGSHRVWQLEPRAPERERTISTTSTASTRSSYALISDPEISSSFAASLESGHTSESEEVYESSPAVSLPSSRDDLEHFVPLQHRTNSHAASPRRLSSVISSFSSVESLGGRSGRLLTLHLEKAESMIWPALIIGPVSDVMSPLESGPPGSDYESELKYNMDPTSLGLLAENLFDVRNDREEAFECYARAWHAAHTSLSILRLVTHYLPPQITWSQQDNPGPPRRGTTEYYVYRIGGPQGLAQLFVEAGMLHLDGAAAILMSSSTVLSSTRSTEPRSFYNATGTEAWRRDREYARRYFDRARVLCPSMNVPVIPFDGDDIVSGRDRSSSPGSSGAASGAGINASELRMPSMDIRFDEPDTPRARKVSRAPPQANNPEPESTVRPRRRRKDDTHESMVEQARANEEEDDNFWYLYVPGLIGAGTALLVVGVVSALSFSSWRKQQG